MYQSLYRKYRPKSITDVVGQKIAVKIIKNSLNEDKVNHAYMFSGPRGTGKTTMAKILAKSINCLNRKDGIACDECKNCLEINSGSAVDVIEIDAASNNGVDEIREIRNNVTLSCSSLKYKVYIIDEVHMLTIGAFNALLKTLEEPPEHIIFILATTDIQKVPSTIISRCQCINFESISDIDIKDRLKFICEQEKKEISEEVLLKIAEISNGGLRDAIGNLEKIIAASSNEKIEINDFNEIFGFVDHLIIDRFLESIINAQIKQVLKISEDLYTSGKNYILFTNELIESIRKKIRLYYETNNGNCELCSLIFSLNTLCNELKTTDNIKALFEAGIINIITNLYGKKVNSLESKTLQKTKENLTSVEEKIIEKKEVEEPIIQNFAKDEDENQQIRLENNQIIKNNAFATANKNELLQIKKDWLKLNDYLLDAEIGSVACFLVDGNIRVCGEEDLIISYEYDSMVKRGISMYSELIRVIKQIVGKDYNVSLLTDEEWNKEKKEYIHHVKNNISYEKKTLRKLIDNKNKVDNNSNDEIETASLLFGADIVEIK